MQSLRFCIYLRFAFFPFGAAVCAQHMEFDMEADFDVRFAVARQNPRQSSKKQKFSSEIFTEKTIFGVGNSNVRNRLKRVLAKFRGDPSQV